MVPPDVNPPASPDSRAIPIAGAENTRQRVTSVLERLAAFTGSRHRDAGEEIDRILILVADSLDAGTVGLVRIVDGIWQIEHLHERTGLGLRVGQSLPGRAMLEMTTADGSMQCLVVEDLAGYAGFPALAGDQPWRAGALTAVPLAWDDGRPYGALCAFHAEPRAAPNGELPLLRLAGHMIVEAVEAAGRRERYRQWNRQLARYAAVVAASGEAILSTDSDGRVDTWNPAAERMFGYSAGEITGKVPRILTARPEDLEEASIVAESVQRGEHVVRYETVRRRKDGSLFDVAFSASPITDESGRVIGSAVIARDISERNRAEAALLASELQFRGIFEHAPMGMVMVDVEGRILLANAAVQRILGYDDAELRQLTFVQITHPDDKAADWKLFQEVLAGVRDAYSLDKRFVHKDGRVVWAQLSVSATRDAGGAVKSIVGMLLDVTERHTAAETLAESEARFRALTEHSGDVTRILDVDGTIRYASASQSRVLGVDPAAVVGHTSFEFMDPVVVPLARATLAAVVETGMIHRLVSRIRHADGTYHTFEAVMQSRLDDPAVRGIVLNSRDITDRVEAEAALRASEERYRQVEQHAPIGLALMALDGRWTRVNPALCILLGYTEEELLVRANQDFTHADDLGVDVDRLRDLVAGEVAVCRWEKRYIRKDGSQVWVLLSASLLRGGTGDPQYVIAQVLDISDHKQVEGALEKAKAAAQELAGLQSDFVARVSHELRTPLTAIIGFGELLQVHWGEFSEALRLERINQIVAAANRQRRLVEDLLLVSRLDATSLITQSASAYLATLLRQVVAELQVSYPGQHVIAEGAADLRVWVDAARASQVLTNLLDNAAKYSPEGSAIAVSWGPEGKQAVVRVRDHGPGIPESGREQLFTRFGRVVGSRIRAGHVGTGLGLYISRGLAEAMGGDLDLEDTGPQGSTFRLRLPVATAEPAREAR